MEPHIDQEIRIKTPTAAFLTFFVLLCLFGGVGWSYRLTNKHVSEKAQIMPTAENSAWKTYRDAKYGFEFEYPNNWSIDGNALEGENSNGIGIIAKNSSCKINIWSEDAKNLSLKTDYVGHYPIVASTSVVIGGIQGLRIRSSLDSSESITLPFSDTKNIKIYLLDSAFHTKSECAQEYNQILSTFKFTTTSTSDTSTWKTYKNDEYGFESQYPAEWVMHPELVEPYSLLWMTRAFDSVHLNNRGQTYPNTCQVEYSVGKYDGNFQNLTNHNVEDSSWVIASSHEINMGGVRGVVEIGNSKEGIQKNAYFYSIPFSSRLLSINLECDPVILEQAVREFNQILSTFKFTQ